ncbi:MAG: hypothetical protein EXR07_16125 [Acetobacteraceae bacterium]|nr:hypothetical protein [Acetobacteraceae bacterium]
MSNNEIDDLIAYLISSRGNCYQGSKVSTGGIILSPSSPRDKPVEMTVQGKSQYFGALVRDVFRLGRMTRRLSFGRYRASSGEPGNHAGS